MPDSPNRPPAESTYVWTGYDDDESWFPLFATKELAQQYAEDMFREEMTGLGHDMDDVETGWSERTAYTEKHGYAGLFDLIEETGGSGYVVCTLPVHASLASARKQEAAEMVR